MVAGCAERAADRVVHGRVSSGRAIPVPSLAIRAAAALAPACLVGVPRSGGRPDALLQCVPIPSTTCHNTSTARPNSSAGVRHGTAAGGSSILERELAFVKAPRSASGRRSNVRWRPPKPQGQWPASDQDERPRATASRRESALNQHVEQRLHFLCRPPAALPPLSLRRRSA